MKSALLLYALALVAPIAATPAPKHSEIESLHAEIAHLKRELESYREYPSSTGESSSESTGTGAYSAQHGKNQVKDVWHKSTRGRYHGMHHKSKGENTGYPTMSPSGGFEGSPTGGTGTGGLPEPTFGLPGGQGGKKQYGGSNGSERCSKTGGNNGAHSGAATGGPPAPTFGPPVGPGGKKQYGGNSGSLTGGITAPTGIGNGGNNSGYDGGGTTAGNGSPTSGSGSPTGSGNVETGTPTNSPSSGNSTVVSSGSITLPAGCSTRNGIGIGWLPGNGETIGDINSALGTTACFDGQYAQITQNGAYTDSSNQLLPSLTQIVGGKTVFIASLMPSIPLSSIDATVAGGVANVMKQFTDKGIEVWLRFAHEMNWYVTEGTYHGSSDDFQKAWATISSAVQSNSQVKMFWSPNEASAATIQSGGWYPTSGKVDLVGIDIYPKSQQTFGEVYGDFCKTFSNAKNIPFVIGETGAGPDIKQYWLGQLAAGDKTACSNYVGFSWFDYNKEADFRVVGGGSTIAKTVLG